MKYFITIYAAFIKEAQSVSHDSVISRKDFIILIMKFKGLLIYIRGMATGIIHFVALISLIKKKENDTIPSAIPRVFLCIQVKVDMEDSESILLKLEPQLV